MSEADFPDDIEPDYYEWHTDRTRYTAGFDCPWKRLLGFHAFATGISRPPAKALSVGLAVHKALELILLDAKQGITVDASRIETILKSDLSPMRDHIEALTAVVSDPEKLQDAIDIIEALPHAYARIALPYLDENFRLDQVEIERELQFNHSTFTTLTDPSNSMVGSHYRICFNSRSDFDLPEKHSGKWTVHDFKTASSFNQDRDILTYADNIQMMINSAQLKAAKNLDYYPDYYIHTLLKGNDWSPSPFVYAYVREGVPPMQSEDWQPKYWLPPSTPGGKKRSIGRAYQKTRVSSRRDTHDWVWNMPDQTVAEQIIVLGPFNVDPFKVEQFLRGLTLNEKEWAEKTEHLDWRNWADIQFQRMLDRLFPRTFNCYTYGQRCQFYDICFRGAGWERPLKNGWTPREPHHPQEPRKEPIE